MLREKEDSKTYRVQWSRVCIVWQSLKGIAVSILYHKHYILVTAIFFMLCYILHTSYNLMLQMNEWWTVLLNVVLGTMGYMIHNSKPCTLYAVMHITYS